MTGVLSVPRIEPQLQTMTLCHLDIDLPGLLVRLSIKQRDSKAWHLKQGYRGGTQKFASKLRVLSFSHSPAYYYQMPPAPLPPPPLHQYFDSFLRGAYTIICAKGRVRVILIDRFLEKQNTVGPYRPQTICGCTSLCRMQSLVAFRTG